MEIEGINRVSKYRSGDSALNLVRDNMEILPVQQNGKITDFDRYEGLLLNILNNDMRFKYEDYSFLITEDNMHNRAQR